MSGLSIGIYQDVFVGLGCLCIHVNVGAYDYLMALRLPFMFAASLQQADTRKAANGRSLLPRAEDMQGCVTFAVMIMSVAIGSEW